MSLKIALSLLAATAHTVNADFSHPMHFRKVDAHSAHAVAASKGRVDADGNAPLFAEQGFWFSHFTVGASPDLEILIDTGSADAILNPGVYKPSSGSVNTGRPFHIGYATTNPDGSGELSVRISAIILEVFTNVFEKASGKVYQDVITQLGANLTVKKQYLGAITKPTSPPTFPNDGLIGYSGINSAALNENPFFHSLCEQGSLSACRFGLALKPDQTGTLYYGTVATDQFAGALTSVKIKDEWVVSGDITLKGKTVFASQTILTDSGTTVIFGPISQVKSLFKSAGIQAVQNPDTGVVSGYYNCDSTPTIGLSFGGVNFNILSSAMAFEKKGNNCTSTIHGTSSFGNNWADTLTTMSMMAPWALPT
ncbi:hypothetical protein Golomagni_07724 [Golovinomyces magnicellulatus]|nr:hypothetical protein Golomagni_07724 [Golovinomyces magnicellulatus]